MFLVLRALKFPKLSSKQTRDGEKEVSDSEGLDDGDDAGVGFEVDEIETDELLEIEGLVEIEIDAVALVDVEGVSDIVGVELEVSELDIVGDELEEAD